MMTAKVRAKELATIFVTILVRMIALRDVLALAIVHVKVLLQVPPPHVRVAIPPVKELVMELALVHQRVQHHAQVQVAHLDVQINALPLVDTHAMIPVMIPARVLLQDLHHALIVPIHVKEIVMGVVLARQKDLQHVLIVLIHVKEIAREHARVVVLHRVQVHVDMAVLLPVLVAVMVRVLIHVL